MGGARTLHNCLMSHLFTRTALQSLALLGLLLLGGCATDDLKGCEPTQQAGIYYCVVPAPDVNKR